MISYKHKHSSNQIAKNYKNIKSEKQQLVQNEPPSKKDKKNNQDRKRQATVDFNDEPNAKPTKLLKYDPIKLMNKLEEFSDVWNDCPTVENPKQNYNNWIEGEDDKPANKNIGSSYNTVLKKYNDKNGVADKIFNNNRSVQKECENVKHTTKSSDVEISKEKSVNNSTYKLEKYDSKLADFKRKKAVQEQRQLHVDQKNMIKKALSSLDEKQKINKKIVFEDAEEIEDDQENKNYDKLEESKTEKRQRLFDDDSELESEFKINRAFEGKKGQKLLELQSKFASDSRFTLDTRFYESGSEESENEMPYNTNDTNEKKKQLAILESIVKQKITPLSEIKKSSMKKFKNTLIVRFDPSREDHQKYILQPQELLGDKKKPKKKKKMNNIEATNNVQENITQVSNEKFYTVKEDLKDVLTIKSGTEFSLLKMFDSKGKEDFDPEPKKYEIIKKPKHSTRNPFRYDSSESEPEEEVTQSTKEKSKEKRPVKHLATSWRTTFFFVENDSRLQEAMEFLKGPDEIEDCQEYAEKRKILKNFIRHKFKNNNRKKGPFKKKLGGLKRKVFQKNKGKGK